MEPTGELSVRCQCDLLGIHRSGLYYAPAQESEENLAIMRLMDERYLDKPTHGVLQMQDYLRDEGYGVNHKRVRRLLRLMGLEAIYPKINLSRLGQAEYIHPYLLRGLEIAHPNQVWEVDITYIALEKGFMYLTAVIDVYSRYVVGWGLSNSLEADASLSVLREAIARHGKPAIVNSDQGSQFTCKEWVGHLKEEGIRISMDGKGRALDNIYIERLWRTLKRDYVYLNPAKDGWELYQGVKSFFSFYNHEKHHQGIGRCVPVEVYKQQAA
ncbi:IS3 family transposase [Pontibacter pamirensis]|uniref:IS3 family transposase n=1 Tax=Pontibacter pamirensis TaxID=2562824 RepID=UPI001F01B38E|nr:IS3 family transposase [Pontibacter pamirensis]